VESFTVWILRSSRREHFSFGSHCAIRVQPHRQRWTVIQIPNVADGRLALSGLVVLKDIPDKPDNANANQQAEQDAISSGPAVRQFARTTN